MLLASEILNSLVGKPGPLESPRGQIQLSANIDINSYNPQWFDNLVDRVAEHRHEIRASVEKRITGIISRSEAIRYVQLGNPETILIDDGSIQANVVPRSVIDQIEVVRSPLPTE